MCLLPPAAIRDGFIEIRASGNRYFDSKWRILAIDFEWVGAYTGCTAKTGARKRVRFRILSGILRFVFPSLVVLRALEPGSI